MKTPAEMKAALLTNATAALRERQNSQPKRFQKPDLRIEEEAQKHLHQAITKAVATGVNLPVDPIKDPVEFSDNCSYYTNAGGMILEDAAGIPVSVKAAESRSGYCSVKLNDQICVMTVEEAFDRGLREFSGFEMLTSQQRAARHVISNIAEHAKAAIADADDLGKKQ